MKWGCADPHNRVQDGRVDQFPNNRSQLEFHPKRFVRCEGKAEIGKRGLVLHSAKSRGKAPPHTERRRGKGTVRGGGRVNKAPDPVL